MYQDYFGLTRPPFKITPDTSLFFEGSQRGAALDALLYAINSGEGIIKVIGEVGSGKTMLCRMLEVRLTSDVDVIYIANPSLSPDNILHVIAHELHLSVNENMSKVSVMQQIQAYLLEKHASNRQVVLFVEEAQSMPIETLEEIRLLSNLETDENKLLQMVLFGQPELDEKLSAPNIRQLKERITHSFTLSPFPPDDTLKYLNFRLRAVGYKGPNVFNKKTAGVVKKYSNGLTRRINIIADKSLLAAFSEGSHSVTSSHIKSAARDSEFKSAAIDKNIVVLVTGFFLIAAALATGFYLGQSNGESHNSKDTDVNSVVPKIEDAVKVKDIAGTATVAPVVSRAEVNSTLEAPIVNVSESSEHKALISERIADTNRKFEDARADQYSIQLFMARTSDANKVEAFLRDVPETLDFTKIYIYETVISGRLWYSVLYNIFSTQDDAIMMLEKLPLTLKSSDPYLRRLKSLKKEIARNNN